MSKTRALSGLISCGASKSISACFGGGGGDASAPSDLEQLLLSQSDASPYRSGTARLQDTSALAGDYREKLTQQVLDLNGTSQYVTFGDRITSGSPTKLFVSLWVKTTLSSTRILASEYYSTGNERSWTFQINSSGYLRFLGSSDGTLGASTGIDWVGNATQVNDGALHHVAVYFDEGTVQFYVDGETESGATGSYSAVLASLFNTPEPFAIGTYDTSGTPSAIYDGSMWDLRVYEGTAAENAATNISGIYNHTYIGEPSGLFWFEEGNTANVINAVDGTVGTLQNYVSSARPVDTDRTYTVGNRLGYSPRMQFDGTDDYIDVSDFDITNFDASGITVAGRFIWLDTASDALEGIFSNFSNSSTDGFECSISAGSFRVRVSEGSAFVSASSFPTTIGEVVDFVITTRLTGGNLELSLYVNGSLIQTSSAASAETDWTYLANSSWNIGYFTASRYFGGIIDYISVYEGWSSDGTVDGLTETNRWENTGIEDSDWVDQVGSIDGTVNGSPTSSQIVRIPSRYDSQNLDAFGGNLTYSGRCPMDGIGKGPAWQGNGTDVSLQLGTANIPFGATDDFTIEFPFKYVASGTGSSRLIFHLTGSNDCRLFQDRNSEAGNLRMDMDGTNHITADGILTGEWQTIRIARVGSEVTLTVDGVDLRTTTGVGTFATFTEFTWLDGALSSSIGPISITTGGVTTTYAPIEGTRHVAKLTSDSSDTSIIYDAVVGGTLSTLYTLGDGSWELPHLKNGCRWASQNLIENTEDETTFGTGGTFAETGTTPDGFRAFTATTDGGTGATEGPRMSLVDPLIENTTYTIRGVLKAGTHNFIGVRTTSLSVNSRSIIDLSDGSVTSESGDYPVQSVTSLGDGWYEVIVNFTTGSDVTGGNVMFTFHDDGTTSTWNGPAGETFLFGEPSFVEGSVALPFNLTNGNAWEVSALVPCDDQGNSADGNTPNIEAGDHPRGLTVRREGSVADDISKAIGLDVWGDEDFNDVPDGDKITKRGVSIYAADRYGARISGQLESSYTISDSDAFTYIRAVEAADGQLLEDSVRQAIDNFVAGLKTDGLWASMDQLGLLIGPRTMAGLAIPIKGLTPTFNSFVLSDYNRGTGLKGDASTKYIDTGYDGDDVIGDDHHLSTYVAEDTTAGNSRYISGTSNRFTVVQNGTGFRARSSSSNLNTLGSGTTVPCFVGISRDNTANYDWIGLGESGTQTEAESGNGSDPIGVFANGNGANPADSRQAFWSLGSALDLALLEARFATLYSAISGVV